MEELKPAIMGEEEEEKERIRQNGRLDVCYNPEKYGLCHKIEWSDEDEENFKWFDKLFRAESIVLGGRDIPQDKYLWFKSLRSQPKQEWSQKDDEFVDDAIACITRCDERYRDNMDLYQSLRHNTLDVKRWLLNIKKRLTPNWKPSKEQIGALEDAKMRMSLDGYGLCPLLQTLINDLKSL